MLLDELLAMLVTASYEIFILNLINNKEKMLLRVKAYVETAKRKNVTASNQIFSCIIWDVAVAYLSHP
jgi:hypothetical protein